MTHCILVQRRFAHSVSPITLKKYSLDMHTYIYDGS